MRVQVLHAMGQEYLSREEAGWIMEQRFNMVTMTQDIWHSKETLSG